jgi:hypothetical protein
MLVRNDAPAAVVDVLVVVLIPLSRSSPSHRFSCLKHICAPDYRSRHCEVAQARSICISRLGRRGWLALILYCRFHILQFGGCRSIKIEQLQ